MLGIGSAACVGSLNAAELTQAPTTATAPSSMTADEQAFAAKLNQNAYTTFKNMSKEQRSMCMQMCSHECKSKNGCKGMGNCKTADNSCAGKNACKGKGGC